MPPQQFIATLLNILFIFFLYLPIFIIYAFTEKLRDNNHTIFSLLHKFFSFISVFLFILVLNANEVLFPILGYKFAPDYSVGLRLYNGWTYVGLFFVPLGLYLLLRVFGFIHFEFPNSFRFVVTKRIFVYVFFIVILIVLSYILYTMLSIKDMNIIQSMRNGANPGVSLKDNIFVYDPLHYSVVLYPRNGSWANQVGYSFVTLPDSENGYDFSISVLESRIYNGEHEYYNEEINSIELLPAPSFQKLQTFSKDGIEWTIYKDIAAFEGSRSLVALGLYEDILIKVRLNYIYKQNRNVDVLAAHHFRKMIDSLTFRNINN